MKEKKDHYINIVLVKSLTVLGRAARLRDPYEYTHISMSFEDAPRDFVSFARRRHFAPFDAGFVHECLSDYAYGTNPEVKLKIFRVPVSKKQYSKIRAYVDYLENDPKLIFNFYGMFRPGFRVWKAYNCMSFIGRILSMAGIPMDRRFDSYNIPEMEELLENAGLSGEEGTYSKEGPESPGYMDFVGIFENIFLFLKLNVTLINRRMHM